jgi:hypothetical protein
MPITFAQPDPMAPAVTASAAAAEFAAKTFPTIASIYENAARIRASAGGGGGGGHGGVVQGGGPIQVLPSGDGGAGLYQVEAQANREQRAMDLSFEAGQDPVSRHIVLQDRLRQNAEDRHVQQQNEQFKLMNPDLFPGNAQRSPAQQAPEQAAPQLTTFTPDDQEQLAAAMQGITDLRKKVNMVPPAAFSQMMAPLERQRDALLAKQRKAGEDALQQKNQQEMKQSLHVTAMQIAAGQGMLNHIPTRPSDIPGMPPDRTVPDGRGGWKNINEPKQLEMQKASHAAQLKMLEIQAKDRSEKDAGTQYLKDRAAAVAELGNKVTGKMPSEEEIQNRIFTIRAHRDKLSGKTPQDAQPSGGGTSQNVLDARKRLLDSIAHTMPIPQE